MGRAGIGRALAAGLVACAAAACDDDDDDRVEEFEPTFAPAFDANDFNAGTPIDNPYLPLIPGTTRVYRGETDEGTEVVTVTVTGETREILGVRTTVVRDTVTRDGEVVEDTFDWFAQDRQGNVWYFGEDSTSFEDGEPSKEGSWEAGVGGAQPGIVMPANPAVGQSYRQELAPGVAEDTGEVVDTGVSVTVPAGSFDDCIRTEDLNPLEPDVVEHKVYCRGVGEVLAEEVEGGEGREALVDVTTTE